jgi:hypothetical protein
MKNRTGRRLNLLSPGVILVLALLVTGINLNTKPWRDPMKVLAWDVKSYYAYLPAALIYHDLSMEFTKEDHEFFGDKFWPKPTPSGGLSLVMTMGLAFLYLPFFLAGHLYAWLSGAETHGFSEPYIFFLVFSALAYLLAGLTVLRWLMLKYFPDWIVALTLLAIVAGTNLLYYSSVEAPMSHAYSFALFAFFLAVTMNWYRNPGLKNSILLGLLAGLITLVRPTNALVLIFFLLWDVKSFRELGERTDFLAANWRRILIMTGAAFLVWLPQLIYWKSVSGQWLYYSYNEEGFFFSNPQLINGLFSYRKGWLLYTPVMLLSLAGLPLLWKYRRGFFWPLLCFLGVKLYVVFSWWTWWYGGGFGQRPLVESYALLSIPMATLLLHAYHRGRWIGRFIVGLVFLFVLHNLFQTAQYYYGAIHWDGMNKRAYWASFARPKPLPGFYDLVTPPDYDLALQGVYVNKREPSRAFVVEDRIVNDMERLTPDGNAFLSLCGRYSFSGGRLQSPRYAYTGQYSIMLKRGRADGLYTRLEVEPGEQWHISVKRRSLWFAGYLSVAADDPSKLYESRRLGPAAATKGWDSLHVHIVIPDEEVSFIEVYSWNPSFIPAWFDELEIKKVKGISVTGEEPPQGQPGI